MKKKKVVLALGALALTVGFAAVSTTLYINGTATIKANNDDFKSKVIFTKAVLDGADISETAISADGTTITYSTPEFDTIGESSTLNYEITNTSDYKAQFGADAVVCTSTDTAYETYLNVTEGGALNSFVLERTATKGDSLTVALKQSYVGDTAKSITYKCTINVDAVEATNNIYQGQ